VLSPGRGVREEVGVHHALLQGPPSAELGSQL
jgi:hypothetical protein